MTRTIIVGPPCAGKSTYAWAERGRTDLVIDYDRIASALGSDTQHAAEGDIREAAFAAREAAIGIAARTTADSWTIHTSPTADQITTYTDAGARFVLLDPGVDECLARAQRDQRPDGTDAAIRAWYDNPPILPETTIRASVSDGRNQMATPQPTRAQSPVRSKPSGPRTPVLAQTPAPAGSGSVTVRLYDPIDSWGGEWGISSKEFNAALDSLPEGTTEIRVLINSPGGEVYEGIAIMNALRAHPARVVAVVEGVAASSASFIAASADEVVMMRNSELFIHNAWGIAMGDAADMRESADNLDHFDRNIASVYAAKSGQTVEHWLAEMHKDRFLTADEAVAEGLADRVEGEGTVIAAQARLDISAFARRVPAPRASAPVTNELPSSTEPGDPNRKEQLEMSDILAAGLRERLGVTDAAASDEQLLAAVDEVLAEQTSDTPKAATIPEGTVLMDAAALADLQAAAQDGRKALATQDAARRDQIVAKAIQEGRITPASRDAWRAQLDTNEEGTATLLTSLAANTVPVNEIGTTTEPTEADSLYALAFGSTTKEA